MALVIKTVTKTALGNVKGNVDMYTGGNVDEILTDLAGQIDAKLSSAMHYKGTVATYDALPTENVEIGDVYNVAATGKNYACSAVTPAIAWDELSGVMDLSAYKTDAENEAKYLQIANFSTKAEAEGFRTETEINTLIATAIDAIGLGDLATLDEVSKSELSAALAAELDAKATTAALNAVDAKFADYTKTADLGALATKDAVAYTDLAETLKATLDAKALSSDLTALAARVTQNETDIASNSAAIAADVSNLATNYTKTTDLGVLALLDEAAAKAKLDAWGYGKTADVELLQDQMAGIAAVTMPTKATVTIYELWEALNSVVVAAGASAA